MPDFFQSDWSPEGLMTMLGGMLDDFDIPFQPMRAKMWDEGEHFLLEVELAGIKKEQISLTVQGDALHLAVSQNASHSAQGAGFSARQAQVGVSRRSFALEGVDKQRITAKYHQGMLSVHLPKSDRQKDPLRKIDVE